jgi:hypothetical protein
VEGVDADAKMERVLSSRLHHVLVGADTSSLQSLGRQLLVLIGDQMNTQRELVDTSSLASQVEDANLGVRNTTIKARLGVRLEIDVSDVERERGRFAVIFVHLQTEHPWSGRYLNQIYSSASRRTPSPP